MTGIRGIVINGDYPIVILAGCNHLLFGSAPVSGSPLLKCRRVDELWFGNIGFIAYFQQYAPQFGQPSHVIEMPVYSHILRHDIPDAVLFDKRHKRFPERTVHFVAVAPSAFGEVPCSGSMQGEITRMRSYIKRQHLFPCHFLILRFSIRHSLS